MSKVNKGGRVPTSEKDTLESSDFTFADMDNNILSLDPELKAELKELGLVPRWINAKQYTQGGNFNSDGWRPYKRPDGVAKGTLDFGYGTGPDGYIQRNDLILAVKKQVDYDRYLSNIRRRAEIMSGVNRSRADELRQAVKEAGVKAKVLEGYEDNE